MKFEVPVKSLLSAVKTVGRAVADRTTIPILKNIHLGADSGKLTLRGTDLDVEVGMSIAANSASQGEVCVDETTLAKIINLLPGDGDATFEFDNKSTQLILRCGRSRFKLNTLPASDFPDMARHDSNHRFTIPVTDIGKILKSSFAMSKEEVRYYLNGIYLHVANGDGKQKTLRGVATDGHRLACLDAPVPEGANGMPGVIVPSKTVGVIKDALRSLNVDEIELSVTERAIEMVAGDMTLRSKVVDGTFPDYNRVIPTENDKIVQVSTGALKEAVARVATVSIKSSNGIKLDIDSGLIKLSAQNNDIGAAEEAVEAEYSGEPIQIGFNGAYLADVLNQIEGDDVEISLVDPGSPTLFRPLGDTSFLAVLMPLRI